MTFRPMLAAKCEDLSQLRYPLLATPKVDGIRALTLDVANGQYQSLAVCRSLDRIPNEHIYDHMCRLVPGLDGEIVTYDQDGNNEPFHRVQSKVMAQLGSPDFGYLVFDWHLYPEHTYEQRVEHLCKLELPEWCLKLFPKRCSGPSDAQDELDRCLALQFEGICLRAPDAPYKHGRSTLKQQYLIKYKPFEDAEAVVVGYEELMRNTNQPEMSALGYQTRSSHKEGMTPGGCLGALICRTPEGVEFKLGTGFTQAQRENMWLVPTTLLGKTVKYRYQRHGTKDRPRIPSFLGFRDGRDL